MARSKEYAIRARVFRETVSNLTPEERVMFTFGASPIGTRGRVVVGVVSETTKLTSVMEQSLIMWNDRRKSVEAYMRDRGQRFMQGMARAYAVACIENTPHDTGNAIRNWLLTDESLSDSSETQARDNVTDLKSQPISREAAIAEAVANIDSDLGDILVERALGAVASRPTVSNATPYIDLLEHGYSTQAPAGMTIHGEAAAQAYFLEHRRGFLAHASSIKSNELGSGR